MRPLLDYLIVKTPLIALVEPDVRWAGRVIGEAKNGLGSPKGPELSWSLSTGWEGTEELLHQSGLSKVSAFRKGSSPIKPLADLKGWLASSRHETDGGGTPFQYGIAVFYDFEGFLGDPALGRLVNDLVPLFGAHGASAILVLPHRVPDDHSMISAVTHVRPTADPGVRYQDVVVDVARGLGQDAGDIDLWGICEALAGLSISEAETAVRLAALDRMRAGEQAEPLLAYVERVRGEFQGLLDD